MAKSILNNAKIKGVSIVVGENKRQIDDEPLYYNNDKIQLERLKKTIGFDYRYWSDPETTTCDLCEKACISLFKKLSISIDSIDAIISVTQTPDYYMPGNAHVLHKKLNLNKTTIAIDIEMGCSGYVYGLWLSFMMLNSGLKRILLVAGDTLSKSANIKDRTEAPLFGDAGSATIIDFDEKAKESFFILKSDGEGVEKMYQPAGAYRNPSTEETRQEKPDKDGNIRSDENIYMNGFDIFNFTLTEQPKILDEILEFSNKKKEEIDYFLMHQANVYIVETIIKKAKINLEKAPSKLFAQFGNQNSASIPGVICGALSESFKQIKKQVVLQGFGIGLSWGACQMEFDNVVCLKPEVYKKEV